MNKTGYDQPATVGNSMPLQQPKSSQPIDAFFNEVNRHETNMIQNHKELSILLSRLDEVANRLAPNAYYKNIPQETDLKEKSCAQEVPFTYAQGGIYSGLNNVMENNRVQERELALQIDDLRRKVQFFEQFI